MEEQGRIWVKEFLDYTGEYHFTQPVVAETIGLKQTALNTWRKDGVLWGGGWEKNGRIKYTADGLIAAGLMAEFSWHFGPTKGARFVADRMHWVMELQNDKEFKFLDEVVHSVRPTPGHINLTIGDQTVQKEHDDEPYLFQGKMEDVVKRVQQPTSRVVFPIGLMVAKWALRAIPIMERTSPDVTD